jgi:hypothetical protein
MSDTTEISAHSIVWGQRRPQYESLPGQQPLFAEHEWSCNSAIGAPFLAFARRELFDTGKDLPGADERDQAILWDLE